MAKKKIQPEAPSKSIEEMSDIEFIKSADYLSSPYYRAYMNAQARSVINEAETFEQKGRKKAKTAAGEHYTAPAYASSNQKAGRSRKYTGAVIKGANYSQKRSLFLVLIFLLMLAMVAIAAIGAAGISSLEEYTAVYVSPAKNAENNTYTGMADPALGLIKKLASVDSVASSFYNSYLRNMDGADTVTTIFLYAVPIAALILVILVIVGFVKAFAALLSGRCVNGFYKKYKFGLLAILMLLMSVVIFVGGIFVSGLGIEKMADFLMQKDSLSLYAGYTLYAAIVVSVLTFVFSCFGYKKQK